MFSYALTIFLGALLLFQVQPLIGKYILPWFGGGPGVWTTCMLFFQSLLLGGYAYAHWTARVLRPRAQAALHLVLLAAALALLPITPADSWKPDGGADPTLWILALLTACLGLPYFVLSTTGPLMQHWFSRTHPGRSPYRLYALSNVGSLLALVSYPFFFEPHFSRVAQAQLWSWGLVVYVVCGVWCAMKLWKAKPGELAPEHRTAESTSVSVESQPSALDRWLWLLLPACASVLLLATTNKMCQDVAVIPFLWVLPLALYLLSFIICFDSPRWYVRFPFALAQIAALGSICWVMFEGTDASLRAQVGVHSVGLFVCCMVCHGELYRLRPPPSQLTGFYLRIAAGGALGGLLVAVVAPMIFTDYYELHWGLLLCGGLLLLVCLRERTGADLRAWRWFTCALTLLVFFGLDRGMVWLGRQHIWFPSGWVLPGRIVVWTVLGLAVVLGIARRNVRAFRGWRAVACAWLGLGLAVLAGVLWSHARLDREEIVARSRNFYGTLKVCEYRKSELDGHYFLLQHGRITHGLQFVDKERSTWPVSYYGDHSGISLAVHALPARERRIAVVGLGTGTMAAFGRAGDTVKFYEINREVLRLATSRFTYLSNCAGKVEVAMGDARLSLEREPPQRFDLLALDAFSSDAVPVHLLTKEAFELYDRHMQSNGVIAVHISNRYINLEPVVLNVARHLNYRVAIVDFDEDDSTYDEEYDEESPWWLYSCTWILLTRSETLLETPAIKEATIPASTSGPSIPLWTDDFASLYQVLD